MREPAPDPRDVALGLVVTGVRAFAAAGRIMLLPARVVARTPVVGVPVRNAASDLAAEGEAGVERGRGELEAAVDAVLGAPEVERAIDAVVAGPLVDAVSRSLVEHRVVERIATEVLANADFESAVQAALENPSTQRLLERALESPELERMLVQVVESRLTSELVVRTMASAEVRSALARQTSSLADEMAAGMRGRAERLDDSAERRVRGWLRRPARASTAS